MSKAKTAARRGGGAIPDEMIEAAIDWTVKIRFNPPDEKIRRAFEAWLGSDGRHAEAWRQVQSAQGAFDALPGPQSLNALEKVAGKRRARGLSRRTALKYTVLGGILLAAGLGFRNRWPSPVETVEASTETGQRRTLRLSEGTLIELNTDTALRAKFTTQRRHVHLLRGEILITTGKDTGATSRRPFRVETSFGALEALGTRFAVRLMIDGVRIAVLEGAVSLGNPDDGAVAEAGETWILNDRGPRQTAGSARDATDWVEGVIVARNMPLPDLLAELSRYRAGEIIWDSRVANLKVSGIYQTRDVDKALSILSRSLPVVLTGRSGNAIYISPSIHSTSPSDP